ncbi:hypothetical protein ABT237_34575 [Streptomyces sp. NPDC001581]|uniref:hypothetical protein n=1 Tax=Streptomyces sp. NPDC001581 TaxID=3154386 RepID=UPI00331B4E46
MINRIQHEGEDVRPEALEVLYRLFSEDEARALTVLLGVLDDDPQSEGVRHAAGEMRFCLGSRLA